MKITIDTKEDSHSEIRKVIKMLEHLVGEGASANFGSSSNSGNIFEKSSSSLGVYGSEISETPEPNPEIPKPNAFASMFGGSSETPSPKLKSEEDEDDREEETERIELIEY